MNELISSIGLCFVGIYRLPFIRPLHRIAHEQREADRKKRLFIEEEIERKRMKQRYQKEATEVKLGERDMISQEAMNAHLSGYKMTLANQARSNGLLEDIGNGPRVREPGTGLHREPKMDRDLYIKRQKAGGGVPSNSIQAQERNWDMTVSTLFCA